MNETYFSIRERSFRPLADVLGRRETADTLSTVCSIKPELISIEYHLILFFFLLSQSKLSTK